MRNEAPKTSVAGAAHLHEHLRIATGSKESLKYFHVACVHLKSESTCRVDWKAVFGQASPAMVLVVQR